MKRFNRRGGLSPSSLFSWLPLLLIAGAAIWLLSSGALSGLGKALKALFQSIGDGVSSAKDWFQFGGAGQAYNIPGQVIKMREAAVKSGLNETPLMKSKAVELHDAINVYHPMALSSMLYEEDAIRVRDIFINNSLEDQARILLSYGEQSAPSRLLLWNILWDDTSGTFRDHVHRYVPEGETRKVLLHYIDYAIITYLT